MTLQDIGSILAMCGAGGVFIALLRYRQQTFDALKERDERITKTEEAGRDCERRYGELKGYVEGVRAGVQGLDVLANSNAQLVAVVRDSMRVKTGRTDIPADLREYLLAVQESREGATPVETPSGRAAERERKRLGEPDEE